MFPVSPVLQERNGNVKGTDQVDGNKAGGALGLTEGHGGSIQQPVHSPLILQEK